MLENKWTAEEFSAELEKMKTRESEYGSTLRDIKFVAQRVEDTMLIYKVMGHEQDCSALVFAELEPSCEKCTELIITEYWVMAKQKRTR